MQRLDAIGPVVRLAMATGTMFAAIASTGCSALPGAARVAPTSAGHTATVVVQPALGIASKRLSLLAVQSQWTASDIALYVATLTAWDGAAYAPIGTGLSVTVDPNGLAPQSRATFTNLVQGKRYRVDVVALGNHGGTEATTVLNGATPSFADYDFTGNQSVEDTHSASVAITLDPVAFSGTLTMSPTNIPAGTAGYTFELRDTDAAASILVSTYAVGQVQRVNNLKVGIHYQVVLTAKSSSGEAIGQAESEIIYFDPTAPEIEQGREVPLAFD